MDEQFKELRSNPQAARPLARVEDFTGPWPTTPLWEHQRRAVEKALPHEGYYLAHDMGAGKTISAIAVALRRNCETVLVFCPKRVISSWADQIERHAPERFTVLALDKGSLKKRVERAAFAMSHEGFRPLVIIINYEAATSEEFRKWALKQRFDMIVCDEAHRLKSPGGVTSKFLGTLARRATWRLCLSGTPFAHGPLDIYGQFRFLDPDIFGTSFTRFRSRYAITNPNFHNQVVQFINQDELHEKFYSIADRVMTRDVVELPEERDEILYAELSTKARKHYDEIDKLFWSELAEDSEVTIANALTRLLRMQQITSGFVKDDDGAEHDLDDAKRRVLADLLEDIPLDEPVVIFSRFRRDLDTLRAVVEAAGRRYGEISGLHDDYARWQRGEIDTVGIQLQAGGEGLNDLVRARLCIYYSVDHSLKNYVQSRARIMRPGQKQNCIYWHIVCRNTVDEDVYAALKKRQDVITALLDKVGRDG